MKIIIESKAKNKLEKLSQNIDYVLGIFNLKFNEKRHSLPPVEKPKKKLIVPPTDDKIKYTKESFIPYLPNYKLHNNSKLSEWTIKPNRKNLERIPELTKNDKIIIHNNNKIKIDKYQLIKPFWAAGKTVKQTSVLLTNEHGRGYKERTIQTYFSYYSTAQNLKDEDIQATSTQKERKTA